MGNKGLNILSKILIFVTTVCFCTSVNAAIKSPFVKSMNGVKSLDFTAIKHCQDLYNSTAYNYLPTKMSKITSSERVAQDIINHNIKALFNKPHLKSVSKTAQNVAEGMATDYKSENGHEFSMKFKAIDAKTEFSYKGTIAAKLTYKIDNRALNLEFSKDLAKRTQLVFTHKDNSDERSDLLALRYSF